MLRSLVVAAAFTLLAQSAGAARLYSRVAPRPSEASAPLVEIHSITGVVTPTTINLPSLDDPAYDRASGRLFFRSDRGVEALDTRSGTLSLFSTKVIDRAVEYDPGTGRVFSLIHPSRVVTDGGATALDASVAPNDVAFNRTALSADGTRFYTIDAHETCGIPEGCGSAMFISLDTATGSFSTNPVFLAAVASLHYDPAIGLFGLAHITGSNDPGIYRFDHATGTPTLLMPVDVNFTPAADYDPATGTLYFITRHYTAGAAYLHTADLNARTVTKVQIPFGFYDFLVVADSPVSIPAMSPLALAIMAVGLLAIGLLRH
jgi:hypothetical protein